MEFNLETIIEESIWDVEQKYPLRRAIFTCDGKKITRNLFILGDSEKRNSKIDVIDLEKIEIEVGLSEVGSLSSIELGEFFKEKLLNFQPNECFERNVNGEIPFFTNPIITRKK